jgi:hypothetical protein
MERFNLSLPIGYVESTVWNPMGKLGKNVFAAFSRTQPIIWYFPRWWMFPIWWAIKPIIRNHERGHAWGLKGCQSTDRRCIMLEESQIGKKETLWAKFTMLPRQAIFGRGRFCSACARELRKALKEEEM